ncbi:serine hydrolase [Kineobactrum salinum]|uniref:Serine hydrolase n=1 Tax=Kineobactrum salinum TaxID=2708301 RepID=A0A6C0TZ85_9GAMM|nr:serine hydrolase [Kineobactrum salinum]QIB65086.1 serine hydrolase [Kineobactrum salinum]
MNKFGKQCAALLLCAGSGLLPAIAVAQPDGDAIDQVIARAMDTFQVPGMAVSIVYQGELYYADGHGILEIDHEGKVDSDTLFQIGSVAKAFTAATLALLVDDGALDWDAPVIDYLPEFRMYDPWVTREFTIRDLLTHRSGLPLGAGDLLMFPEGKTTRDEIIYALRHLKPSSSFRSQFDYDNLLYIVASEVVTRVAEMPFEEFLEQRLLQPLGMNDCRATRDRVPDSASTATPHLLIDGKLQITSGGIGSVSAGAGGINCSADSMARWMAFLLDEGRTADGEQLLSTAQYQQLVSPVTLTAPPPYMREHAGSHLSAYALGWGVSTFYGQPLLSHGGGLWGMTTFIALLPEQELAVFASNNQMSVAPRAVVNELLDRFLAEQTPQAGKDWIAISEQVMQERQDSGEDEVARAMAERNADSEPSLPLEAYTGRYRDPWYGDIRIVQEDDGKLWFYSGRNEPLQGPLEHFQYDTFIARWTDRQLMADAYVSFSLSPAGRIERIRMKAVSPNTDFSFDFHDLDLRRVDDSD